MSVDPPGVEYCHYLRSYVASLAENAAPTTELHLQIFSDCICAAHGARGPIDYCLGTSQLIETKYQVAEIIGIKLARAVLQPSQMLLRLFWWFVLHFFLE